MSHKGLHDRGYLPHWDFAKSVQSVTFRLADSLPTRVLNAWKKELAIILASPDPQTSRNARAELQQRIATYEDSGRGACLLRNPTHAEVLQNALIRGHGGTYHLIDWCIMPNHVHVLMRLTGDTPLGTIIKSWKSATAIKINAAEGRTGSLWMAEYFDRDIRDLDHFYETCAYIRNNPVKVGLCATPSDWRFSAAGSNWSAEFIPPQPAGPGSAEFIPPQLAGFSGAVTEAKSQPDETISPDPASDGASTPAVAAVTKNPRGTISPSLPSVSGSSLRGHLDLRCELRSDGVPYVSRQSFRAPVHLSKSHLDQGHLIQSIVNPTAGFFDGDRLDVNIEVAPGAKLILSTPSAARVYRTRSGEAAETFQKFTVGAGAFLEWIPEPFIPHAGSRHVQRTQIELEASSNLLYFDWISPGRVAMGECFAYRRLRWEFDLLLAGNLAARERHDLQPDNESLTALKSRFPAAHYLSVYAAGTLAANWPAGELDALNGENVYLGHGPLPGGLQVIRALCRGSLDARRLIETLRPLLYRAAGIKPPALGRIFC